jgi:glycolate oxidase
VGGTITGEHGVGSAKRRQMTMRFSPAEIAAMRAVKRALDPAGLLNPGVLLPDPSPDEPPLPIFAAAVRRALDAARGGHAWLVSPSAGQAAEAGPPAVDAANMTVTAPAGVPLGALRRALAEAGFRTPLAGPDDTPLAAAIAGPLDRNAVRDTLLAVDATLPDGPAARFGSNAVKDVAGYDLKRLFIGSGGAFGTPRTVTLRIDPGRGRRPL